MFSAAGRGTVVHSPPAWAPGARGTASGGRLHGLDGLRALAIAGVVFYHGDLSWLPGGYLGVDLFFVLSGFLVTSLLLEERLWAGHIDLTGFYARRLRRLFPALAFMLAVLWVTVPWVAPDAFPRLQDDAFASLLYVANWWFIQNEGSYFDFIGRPPLLQHLWSLAIEEQFYLLWPAILTLGLAGARRRVALTGALIACAATLWMTWLAVRGGYPDNADPSRLYFGTDTHCIGLFVGAALAGLFRPWGWRAHQPGHRLFMLREGLGLAGLLGLLCAFGLAAEHLSWLYRGGFLLVAFCSALLIQAVLMKHSRLGWFFERSPLRWVGQRSYALYLWHWPVFMLTRPGLDTPVTGASNLVLRILLVGLMAELSHRLIEEPLMRKRPARGTSRHAILAPYRRALLISLLFGAPAVAAYVLAGAGASERTPPLARLPGDIAEAMGLANGGPTRVFISTREVSPDYRPPALRWPHVPSVMRQLMGEQSSTDTSPGPTSPVPSQQMSGARTAKPATAQVTHVVTVLPGSESGLTAVGDSVLLGARLHLQKLMPAAQTDAEIGRQAAALLARLRDLRAQALLAPTVLVHLGTNGYVTEAQLREALDSLRDRQQVILVNARAPRRWVETNNDLMARVAPEYPNVVLADWAALGDAHPEFFASDGIHLSPTGQRAFVEEILRLANSARAGTLDSPAAPQAAASRTSSQRHPS